MLYFSEIKLIQNASFLDCNTSLCLIFETLSLRCKPSSNSIFVAIPLYIQFAPTYNFNTVVVKGYGVYKSRRLGRSSYTSLKTTEKIKYLFIVTSQYNNRHHSKSVWLCTIFVKQSL